MNRAASAKVPRVKGWCPGAHRPMASGDGLVVRVRPQMSRLDRTQACRLAELAIGYGNGVIDLTSRGNLQIRGVDQDRHGALLEALMDAHLLDATAEDEARRNILTTPFWGQDGLTENLYPRVLAGLRALPDLPAKMGIVLDTGAQPLLSLASGDFRFERGAQTPLILRADGAVTGMEISPDTALSALADLAQWFVDSGGAQAGRMRRHLEGNALPDGFQGHAPRRTDTTPQPGPCPEGYLLGVGFGAVDARGLIGLFADDAVVGLRCTPWRLFLLEGASKVATDSFVTKPGAHILNVHACPGAPLCEQGEIETRALAEALATRMPKGQSLHVSGCAKGCAHAGPADVTLVGADGKFDLVRHGAAWDEPSARGLSIDDVFKELTQ